MNPNLKATAKAWHASRRRALTEWRHLDVVPLETACADNAKPAGTLVANVLSGLRIEKRQAEAEIVRVWNHLLDPNLTVHAQPTGLRNGTLFVTVDHSVWLDEIARYRYRPILAQLQTAFGKTTIARISFRLG